MRIDVLRRAELVAVAGRGCTVIAVLEAVAGRGCTVVLA
jgi:hypothetical protein